MFRRGDCSIISVELLSIGLNHMIEVTQAVGDQTSTQIIASEQTEQKLDKERVNQWVDGLLAVGVAQNSNRRDAAFELDGQRWEVKVGSVNHGGVDSKWGGKEQVRIELRRIETREVDGQVADRVDQKVAVILGKNADQLTLTDMPTFLEHRDPREPKYQQVAYRNEDGSWSPVQDHAAVVYRSEVRANDKGQFRPESDWIRVVHRDGGLVNTTMGNTGEDVSRDVFRGINVGLIDTAVSSLVTASGSR